MKLTKKTQHKLLFTILSFLIPFGAFLTMMFINKVSPFGDKALFWYDMYHQYFPFFKAFRAALLSGDSLLFSWNVGMGVDYLGLYAYYLASPLNLLSVLVPENALQDYFFTMVPIKLGFASMFFGIFLQGIFKKHDLSIPLFGSFYGLCAWALGYQWNIMWLDTFALLPLVMLGMYYLLRDKKFVLYTITLFLSVSINYYIGLFTCFFVFICFFCYELCRFRNWRAFAMDFLRIAVFSLIGIGMTAFVTLPAVAALQNTQSSVNTFPHGVQFNITGDWNFWGMLNAMTQVAGNMNGGISSTYVEGLPNIYCGVFATVLAALYLFNPKIRPQDKICAGGLLLFINLSFIVRQLDYIWHGFHFTNQIPYRFSFLYSFVLLYMAYAAWVNRKHFQLWHIALAGIATMGIIFCRNNLQDTAFWAYNGAFLVLYLAALIYYCIDRVVTVHGRTEIQQALKRKLTQKRVCSVLFLCVIAGELVLNLVNFSFTSPGHTGLTDYPHNGAATADVIAKMNEREKDTLFFRTEVTHANTLNDGALNGYNGISTFTSSANVGVTRFMQALGYPSRDTYNRYCYEEGSPVSNLFLNLKYTIERDGMLEENPYFNDVYCNGSVHLLENNAYLPLGFMANFQLVNVNFANSSDKFAFQNELMRNAAGIDEDVWYVIPGNMLTINSVGASITPKPATGYCVYSTTQDAKNSYITYSYTADREGFVCVDLDLSKNNRYTFKLNGRNLYSNGYSLPVMSSVCTVRPGDVLEVRLDCNANENGTTKLKAAILDKDLFLQCYDKLSASTWELSKFSNTEIEGTVNCQQAGVLYTSIPQNGNWHAYVDGKPAEIVLIGDVMVGLLLPQGQHTVRMVYTNKAFALGVVCSVFCCGLLVAAYVTTVVRKKK